MPSTPVNYKMSEVVNKLLRPSLTSQYHVDITVPGEVTKFLESVGRLGSGGVAAIKDLVTLSCTEASLPGSSLATHEANSDYTGVSEKMAYRRLYDDRIDFTFYVDYDYSIIEVFEGWMNYIVGEGVKTEVKVAGGANITVGLDRSAYIKSNAFYRMTYPELYKTPELYVTKFERDYSGKRMVYQFIDAFPISINSMPVSYDSSQLLKCTVSFSYTRYVRTTTK